MTTNCPQCGAAYSTKSRFCGECGNKLPTEAAQASHSAPQAAARTLKLFLSYGRDDHAAEVRALRDALRARGHEVWFDEEQLGTGLDWEQRIEAGLAWCDRVVLTMTPHSVRRPDGYCLNEIAKALELGKLIIPVLLVEVPQGAPTSICRIQYLDWRDAVPAAEKAERFMQRLARLCEAIEEDRLDFEGGQQRLIRHLQPINFDGDLQRHVASFKGRVLLEARLRDWLADPQGSQVLWLTAAPGLGKSAVAATMAHRWAGVAAVHFCVAGQQDKANPARAILSIAYQLSQRQHMSLYAARLSNLELEREAHKDARTLFDTLLVGQLAKSFPEPPEPMLVILDGLDEATQPGGENPLAEIIAADWGRLPGWLRLMVSSRPEAELVTWLSGTQRIEIRGGDAEQQADLAAFLRERLASIGRPPGKETLERILDRSEGAFHYAVLLIEEVRQGRCDPDNPVDLPAGLNPFYLQTFKRRFSDIAAYRSQTRPLLELILAAPEPVPLAVLAGASKREAQDVRQDLSELGSMLVIEPGQGATDADWDTVRLSHASLRSWLTGLDATRQPLAGAYAAKVNTQVLAVEVLRLWEAGNDSSKDVQDAAIEREGFVARTLWGLLRGAKDEAAMGRVAFDLSLYWKNRQLALAFEPGEFAASKASRAFAAGLTDAEPLVRCGKCVRYLGDLHRALGRSTRAIDAYRQGLAIAERLAAQDPSNGGWQSDLGASFKNIGTVLQDQGNLAGALHNYREGLAIMERLTGLDSDNRDWQFGLGICYNDIGEILEMQGDLTGAMEEQRSYQTIMKRLTALNPDKTSWQRHLWNSHIFIGRIFQRLQDSVVALESYREGLAISQRLESLDRDNADRQYELGVSHGSIGSLLEAQGDFDGAMGSFCKTLAIMERLVASDPDNTRWQRNLGVSHRLIGAVLEAQGNLAGALESLRTSMQVLERLTALDPENADWQIQLAGSHGRAGAVLETQGNLAGALEEFRKDLAIRERLAAQDPDNSEWQRDLSVSFYQTGAVHEQLQQFAEAASMWRRELAVRSAMADHNEDPSEADDDLASCHNQIGGAVEAMEDFQCAIAAFSEYLRLSMNVLELDPEDTTKRRNVAVGQANVARSELALGNLDRAQSLQAQAADTFQALRDPEDLGSQMDWAASLVLGIEIAKATSDAGAAAHLSNKLASIELDTQVLVGRFRIRFLPLVLKHLYDAMQAGDLQQRARVTLRVLRLGAKSPRTDMSPWLERAQDLRQQLAPDDPKAQMLGEFVD